MNKIACILFTYNRLPLLKGLLESLKSQLYMEFDVIVVNNGSTDGTKEWLDEQQNIVTINQYPNIGPAGGVYTGMEYAYTQGYEWFWLMDDDGIPSEDQLSKLLEGSKKCNSIFVNSLVLSTSDNQKLSFGLSYNGKAILTKESAQVFYAIPNTINPWNGTLINRKVRESIGPIKKEMVMWGEEMEFMYRAIKKGFIPYTITDAFHYHPASRQKYANILPFCNRRFKVLLAGSENKSKIMYRNNGYLMKTYFFSALQLLKFKLKYNIYYITRLDVKGLWIFNHYFKQGTRNNYTEKLI